MKTINLFLLAITCLASCFSNPANQLISSAVAQTDNSNLQLLELSVENTKLTLLAPKGAKVIKTSWGSIQVKSGKSFHIELATTTSQDVLAEVRQEIKSNDLNILKRFLIDTPDSILYESSPGMNLSDFHLYTYKNLGDIALTCENFKGAFFSESESRLMLKSCQSIAKAGN